MQVHFPQLVFCKAAALTQSPALKTHLQQKQGAGVVLLSQTS